MDSTFTTRTQDRPKIRRPKRAKADSQGPQWLGLTRTPKDRT